MPFRNFTASVPLLICLLLVSEAPASVGQSVERRRSGDVGGLISAGVINGARLGVTAFVADRLSVEGALGLLRIKLLEAGEEVRHIAGYSVSAGASWYTHGDDPVSPLAFLQTTYVIADGANIDQRRFIVAAGIGTEYAPLKALAVFMRFGPALQTIWTRGAESSEVTLQFDAGLNIFF